MSETIQTKGWPGPKGKCDICNKKKAAYWFGDTSVALCESEDCLERNRENWNRMCREIAGDEEMRRDW